MYKSFTGLGSKLSHDLRVQLIVLRALHFAAQSPTLRVIA